LDAKHKLVGDLSATCVLEDQDLERGVISGTEGIEGRGCR
jgi:hypothetical protein